MFTGTYYKGKPFGQGKYTWANGSVYIGMFKNGLKHGKGRWQKGEGDQLSVFEGEYVNDKKEGFGIFRWASGNAYDGYFKDDERHGKGKMVWTDGSSYEGDWFRGIQHGYGKIMFPDGNVKEGYFDNNVYIGRIKEDDGNYVTLDPSKIFPNSHKMSSSKGIKKFKSQRSHPSLNGKSSNYLSQRSRPKPLIQSKYSTISNEDDYSNTKVTSSLPKLRSPLLESETAKRKTQYSSAKKNNTWMKTKNSFRNTKYGTDSARSIGKKSKKNRRILNYV